MAAKGIVVVGVNGSPESECALRYAIGEANRRAALLRVVSAYDPPGYWDVVYGGPRSGTDEEQAAARRSEASRAVQRALTDERLAPPLQVQVQAGFASNVLVDASRDADVLVLGHRRRPALVIGGMIGSVSRHCLQHADCPVVLVAPPAGQRDAVGVDEAAPAAG